MRVQRVEGKQDSNQEKRDEEKKFRWTIERLWERYKAQPLMVEPRQISADRICT